MFDLPQDMGSYVHRSRDKIADRWLARGGRFLSDLAHIVKDYKADVDHQWRDGSIRELTEAKENAQATQRRVIDAKDREKKLVSEVEFLRKEQREFKGKAKVYESELVQVRAAVKPEKGKVTSLEADVSRLQDGHDSLKKEVADLKLEAEKAAEEMANAMGSGNQGCYERLAKAGIDLTGHSLDDYCADLAKDLDEKNDGDGGATA